MSLQKLRALSSSTAHVLRWLNDAMLASQNLFWRIDLPHSSLAVTTTNNKTVSQQTKANQEFFSECAVF